MKNLYLQEIETVLGKLRILCDDKFIIRLLFENDNLDHSMERLAGYYGEVKICGKSKLTDACAGELQSYLGGKTKHFTVTPFLIGSDFDKRIWAGLGKIPYGCTFSYLALADSCNVKGARAVGSAVGRNPIPVILPCHRVIRSDGGLGGFRGGLKNKRILLKLEKDQKSSPV